MQRTLIPLLAVLLALGVAAPVRALTTISTNVTLPGDPVFGNTINDNVQVIGDAVLTINAGGSVTGDVAATENSAVTVSGGTIGLTLYALHNSTVSVSGAATISGNLNAFDTSTVNVSGGTISGALNALNSSTVSVTGGTISAGLEASDSSTVNVSDGSFGSLFAGDSSTVNVSGGTIGFDLGAFDLGTINLTGGSIGGSLSASSTARLHVFGCNLVLTSTHISGTLLDGTPLNNGVFGDDGIVLHDDLEPPTLTCPAGVTVAPTSSSGAVVTYAVSASDNRAGVILDCDPPSGSLFPVGDTTVNCTATDACGNQSFCSFTVTVLTPAAASEELIEAVEALAPSTLKGGQANALTSKLKAALEKLQQGQVQPAIQQLQAFIQQVQSLVSEGVVTAAEGQALIDAAQAIIAALGG